jgi:hypothetical protein
MAATLKPYQLRRRSDSTHFEDPTFPALLKARELTLAEAILKSRTIDADKR